MNAVLPGGQLSATLFKREAARQSLFQLIHRLLPLLDGIGASRENSQHTGMPDSLQYRVAQQALEALSKQLLLLRPAYAAKSRVMLADCLHSLAGLRGFREFVPVMELVVELNSQTRDGLDESTLALCWVVRGAAVLWVLFSLSVCFS